MTLKPTIFTILLIAFVEVSTVARGETIYKCGNTYAQSPCTQGQTLQIEDTRDKDQKKQTETATHNDAKLAESMQKDRLLQEQKTILPQEHSIKTSKTVLPPQAQASHEAPPTTITPKRLKTKTYKPAGFVALVPGSDQKPVKSKKSKKKKATPPPV
jgi:hypothetical protein